MTWKSGAALSAIASVVCFIAVIVFAFQLSTGHDRNPCANLPAASKGTEPKIVATGPAATVNFGTSICLAGTGLTDAKGVYKPLTLYLNGEPLPAIKGILVDPMKQHVLFHLDRNAKDADTWARLIGAPAVTGSGAGRAILNVSAGPSETSGPYPSEADAKITFLIFEPYPFWLGLATLATAVLALIFVAKGTAILRDGDAQAPYSLARCQMAFWLCLVTASFLYIWFVTGQIDGVLTAECLVLLGISGTTGLASVAIQSKKEDPAAAGAGAGAGAAHPVRSKSFLQDLLTTDVNGNPSMQLHRVQMFIWTIILGMVFLWEVYSGFRMPKFDTNLLIMMGISGSFYLGFKAQEK